jgi:hypothetical protein
MWGLVSHRESLSFETAAVNHFEKHMLVHVKLFETEFDIMSANMLKISHAPRPLGSQGSWSLSGSAGAWHLCVPERTETRQPLGRSVVSSKVTCKLRGDWHKHISTCVDVGYPK